MTAGASATLIAAGRGDVVTKQRTAFQEVVRPLMRRIIEEEMRRPVIAFVTASHSDPDLNAELFVLASDGDAGDSAEAY